MERENDPLFKEIISACENKKIKKLMGFKNHWNMELIAQFYATVFFGSLDGERSIFWMTEGQVYRIKIKQFARLFGLDRHDINRPKNTSSVTSTG
jgi:hypothetical protein